MSRLCDVTGSSNRLLILNEDGAEVIGADIRKGTKDQLIPGRQMNAGNYTLRISSGKHGILEPNFDDFFIQRIELVASGDLRL